MELKCECYSCRMLERIEGKAKRSTPIEWFEEQQELSYNRDSQKGRKTNG